MSKSSVKRLSEDAGDVIDDVVHNLKELTTHLKDDAGDKLSQTAVSLAHAAVELAEEAKVRSKDLAQKAGQQVREHPAATAAIAAAAVALIGLAVASRRKGEA
ncbi:MAG: hypothetical protein ACK4YQ_13945 [Phenylobacterium sp.]|uniref:hypothetical protein n=1 Tax=Phenylobacterium sp. TaxID=1871053 RepID=UPI00391A4171